MESFVLDSETLRAVANTIDNYARRQKEIMNNFLRNVSNLGGEWQDDETFYSLIKEIMNLRADIHCKMDCASAYAIIFRDSAEAIERRPKFGQATDEPLGHISGSTSGNTTISAQQREYSSSKIMQKNEFDKAKLYSDICEADSVGRVENYVSFCVDTSKINDLEHPGTFLSPATGEPIYARRIAYRGDGICTPNALNVCGADFYYKDGTFCGSYTGTSWQDMFELNYSDTSEFRK